MKNMKHLFLKYDVTVRIWNVISYWVNVKFPWTDSIYNSQNKRLVFDTICMITCWAIWKSHNSVMFDDDVFRKKSIKDVIVDHSFDWSL